MKRISPLNAKGSAENNVCPFINKEEEQLTKSSLSLVLSSDPAYVFFLARVLLLKPFTGPMIFIFFADASSQLFT